MPEHFMHLDAQEQQEIFETLAVNMGRKSNVLEKDVWVCWALNSLFRMPDALPMAFKGGTSLSKAFNAINRFSEDIDVTIDYRSLAELGNDDFDPFAENQSNNQIKKYSERLKATLKLYATEHILPHLQSCIEQVPIGDQISLEHAENGEDIWIHFPSVVEEQDDYLKNSIKIELGGRNIIDPNAVHTVTTDIAEPLSDTDLIFPTADVAVLSAERTCWEKATLIHAECNRGSLKSNAERLSRHWYDLYLLDKSPIGETARQDRALLESVVKYKNCFFRSNHANYNACLEQNFILIPGQEVLTALEKDYLAMHDMIYGETPSFEEIVKSLEILQDALNEDIQLHPSY